MSNYLGDFTAGKTVRVFFNTQGATGAPITLASGAVSVYKDGSTTQSTAGVTLTADFDSLTGLHLVAIDTAADGTFYSGGSDFEVVLTGGTVDSLSVVGKTLGKFSLANRSALRPTTADRTLDVTAGGAAGVDWANVEGPTTAVTLSGTTVKTATDVEADTQDLQSRLPAALIGGRMDSNVQATAATLVFNLTGSISGSVGSVAGNVGGSVASVTGLNPALLDVAVSTRLAAASYTAPPTEAEIAAEVLTVDFATLDDTNSRCLLQAVRWLRNRWSLAEGGVLTVYKEDDATTAWTAAVTQNASAQPVTGSDPA